MQDLIDSKINVSIVAEDERNLETFKQSLEEKRKESQSSMKKLNTRNLEIFKKTEGQKLSRKYEEFE